MIDDGNSLAEAGPPDEASEPEPAPWLGRWQQPNPKVEREERRRGLPIRTIVGRFVVWPLCGLSLLAHVTFGHEDYTTAAHIQAGLLSCLSLLSLAWAPVRVMPALAIGMGFFYFALGAPVFSRCALGTTAGMLRISNTATEDATLAALVFACTVVVSALASDRWLRRAAWAFTRKIDGTGPFTSIDVFVSRGMAFLSLGLHIAHIVGVKFGGMTQPIALFSSPIICLTLFYWNAERSGSVIDRYIYWGSIVACAGFGMMTGMLGDALTPGIVAGCLMWAGKARLPLGVLGLGIALLLFFTPVKGVYRSLTWFGRERHTTVMDRAVLWGTAIERTYGGEFDIGSEFGRSLQKTLGRLGVLGQVGQIFEWVPNRVPFAGLDQWLALPTLAVPRFLWPDKPGIDGFYNRTYTHTFKLQNRMTSGSITLPSVGDGYWRLGWAGVVLEGILLGAVLGAAQGVSRGGSRSALLLAGSLLQLRTDSQIIGSLTGTIQQCLVALAVAWLTSELARLFADAPSVGAISLPAPSDETF